MADFFSAKITGNDETIRRLKDASEKVGKKATRAIANQGSKLLLGEAKARVKVVSGLTRRSLGRKVKQYPSGIAVGVVGPRAGFREPVKYGRVVVTSDPRFTAHLMEGGTKAHPIGRGIHPGTAAHPFLRPALETVAPTIDVAALNIVKNALADAAGGAK